MSISFTNVLMKWTMCVTYRNGNLYVSFFKEPYLMILIFAYLHIWSCIGVSKWLVLTSFNHADLQYPIKHHHDFLLYENCWIYLSKTEYLTTLLIAYRKLTPTFVSMISKRFFCQKMSCIKVKHCFKAYLTLRHKVGIKCLYRSICFNVIIAEVKIVLILYSNPPGTFVPKCWIL